jgi:hypothetical protein
VALDAIMNGRIWNRCSRPFGHQNRNLPSVGKTRAGRFVRVEDESPRVDIDSFGFHRDAKDRSDAQPIVNHIPPIGAKISDAIKIWLPWKVKKQFHISECSVASCLSRTTDSIQPSMSGDEICGRSRAFADRRLIAAEECADLGGRESPRVSGELTISRTAGS